MDQILKSFPDLEYLNGLKVERDFPSPNSYSLQESPLKDAHSPIQPLIENTIVKE